jgi:hypothetical protein
MKKSKLETARDLAKKHFGIEPYLKRVFLIEPVAEDDPDEPIKLLEVVEGAIERGIEPIGFVADPARGIEYPVVIVDISPHELEAIQAEKLALDNEGWTIGRELLKDELQCT